MGAVASFIDELRAIFRSPIIWMSWVVLTGALALSGPFGTYSQLNLDQRLVLWALVVAGCLVVSAMLRLALMSRFKRLQKRTATVIAGVVSAPFLAIATRHVFSLMHWPSEDQAPNLVELTLTLVVIGVGVGFLCHAVATQVWREVWPEMKVETPVGQAVAAPHMSRLMTRIEPELRGELIRVSARDHYLDVVTDKGTAEILMRLSDAVAELEDTDGLRVHRSHWVAVAAVAALEREGDKWQLVLRDGSRVPVSRTYRSAVAERGLI